MAKIKKKPNAVAKPRNHPDVGFTKKVEKSKGKGAKQVIQESERGATQKPSRVNMLSQGEALVGLSKGCTINMGNYQSAKIDCWISRVCPDNEKDIMDNLADIGIMLDEQIEYESSKLNED